VIIEYGKFKTLEWRLDFALRGEVQGYSGSSQQNLEIMISMFVNLDEKRVRDWSIRWRIKCAEYYLLPCLGAANSFMDFCTYSPSEMVLRVGRHPRQPC
jgi:hypothetical protein